jgi:hypothetical protein
MILKRVTRIGFFLKHSQHLQWILEMDENQYPTRVSINICIFFISQGYKLTCGTQVSWKFAHCFIVMHAMLTMLYYSCKIRWVFAKMEQNPRIASHIWKDVLLQLRCLLYFGLWVLNNVVEISGIVPSMLNNNS